MKHMLVTKYLEILMNLMVLSAAIVTNTCLFDLEQSNVPYIKRSAYYP